MFDKCPECNGEGTIKEVKSEPDYPYYEIEYKCRACKCMIRESYKLASWTVELEE
jgi:DnaJ-class molecular chaperone